MTQEEIKSVVKSVMESVMPTMAEAIAKSLAQYVTEPKDENILTLPTARVEEAKVEEAKVVAVVNEALQERKAIIGEYSEKSLYFVGSLREDGEKIKGIKGCFKFGNLRAYGDGSDKGWTFTRKDITPEQLSESLRAIGYDVTYGDSCLAKFNENKAKDEANKTATPAPAPAPKAETPSTPKAETPKVVAMERKADMNVQSFRGTLYNCTKDGKTVKVSNVMFTQVPTLHEAYYYTDGKEKLAIYAGGNDTWMFMGSAKTLNGKSLAEGGTLENHDAVYAIASKGVADAIANGVMKKAAQYMVDAYTAGGCREVAKWLKAKVA